MGQAFLMGKGGSSSLSPKMIKNSYEATCYATEDIQANMFVSPVKGISGYGRTMGSTLTSLVSSSLPKSTYPYIFQVAENKWLAFQKDGNYLYVYPITVSKNNLGIITSASASTTTVYSVNLSYELNSLFRFSDNSFIIVARDNSGHKYYVRMITFNSAFTSATSSNVVNYSYGYGSSIMRFCKLTDSRFALVSTNNATSSSYDFWSNAVINISGTTLSIYKSGNMTGSDNRQAATDFCLVRASDTSYWVISSGYGCVLFNIGDVIQESTLKSNKKASYSFSDYLTINGEVYGFRSYQSNFYKYKVGATTVTDLGSITLPNFRIPGTTSTFKYPVCYCYNIDSDSFLAFYDFFESGQSSTSRTVVAGTSLTQLFINGSSDVYMAEVQQFSHVDQMGSGMAGNDTNGSNACKIQKLGDIYNLVYRSGSSGGMFSVISFSMVPMIYQTVNSSSVTGIATKPISKNTQGEIIASCKI